MQWALAPNVLQLKSVGEVVPQREANANRVNHRERALSCLTLTVCKHLGTNIQVNYHPSAF